VLAIVDSAAQALKDEIETKVARLPVHPNLYRAGRVAGTREMVVHGTIW
jgi:toxin ParE1/3/4